MTDPNGTPFQQVAADILARQHGITTKATEPGLTKSWQHRKPPAICNDLDLDRVSRKVQDAMRQAYKEDKWPIYLYGPTGRGKTYAAAWLFQAWPSHEQLAQWYPLGALLTFIASCRRDGAQAWNGIELTERGMVKRIAQASLVVFDDIGTRPPSDASYEALYNLIESRKDKPTIYTSNIDPRRLESVYDARISSRLLTGTLIEFGGKDLRLERTRYIKVTE